MKEKDDIALSQWLSGDLTAEQLKSLNDQYDLEALRTVLDRQETLDLETVDSANLWDSVEQKISRTKPFYRRKWFLALLVCGAIIAAIFLYGIVGSSQIKTQETQNTERLFADGTKVILSPSSSLKFTEKNWSDERRLKLKGQAFFAVEKGTEFIVETDKGSVTVLGTEFEIWESGETWKVLCMEGKVKVSNSEGTESIDLTVGDQVFINNNVFSKASKHESIGASFLTDQQQYQGISADALMKEVERFYGLKVKQRGIEGPGMFSGVLILNDLEKALDYIARSMNWNYEMEKESISFSPRTD